MIILQLLQTKPTFATNYEILQQFQENKVDAGIPNMYTSINKDMNANIPWLVAIETALKATRKYLSPAVLQ